LPTNNPFLTITGLFILFFKTGLCYFSVYRLTPTVYYELIVLMSFKLAIKGICFTCVIILTWLLLLIWAYLTLSCWSHCIWWGINGSMEMCYYILGLILSSKSNNLDELPFHPLLLNGSYFISRLRVYFLPNVIW